MPDIPSSTQNSFAKVTPTNEALVKGIVKFSIQIPAITNAITQLIGDIDWKDDAINQRVIYKKEKIDKGWTNASYSSQVTYPTKEEACKAIQNLGGGFKNYEFQGVNDTTCYYLFTPTNETRSSTIAWTENNIGLVDEYLTYAEIATQIQTNAATGDADANAFIADVCNPLNWTESDYPLDMQSIKDQLEAKAPKE